MVILKSFTEELQFVSFSPLLANTKFTSPLATPQMWLTRLYLMYICLLNDAVYQEKACA